MKSLQLNFYRKLNFNVFREITGYLVMYRVYGLRTLEHMFPNLAVIRGDELILHYAFMLFEMNELTEVIPQYSVLCDFLFHRLKFDRR